MTTVATLDTVMRLNAASFRQGMVEAAAQANRSLGSIQKQAAQTASVLLSLKRAANTFGSFYLVKQGLSSLVQAQKQLQAIEYTFNAATGSAMKGAAAFDFVRTESQKLGLVLPDAAEGFARLSASATAAGVSMDTQQQLFDAYAKSVTTLHLGSTQANRALLALEQMFAKGKVQAQELRLQLGQAIPGAAQRFQNAVLDMTKGTALAGKSFDQLLAGGKLLTSQFAPALVTALQGAARGWEQASHSLNSNLNRVQTAWFNLKADVSSGLFNDATTAGAGLLADNLGRLANAATLLGAGTLARVLGGQISNRVAAPLQRYSQEQRGAQMAAAAEQDYARGLAAAARAESDAAAAAARLVQQRSAGAQSVMAASQASAYQAQIEKEAAAATLSHQAGAMTLSANIRAQQVATLNLAKAEAVLLRARTEANAAAIAATAADADLVKVRARLAVANEAVAVAAARMAEANALATTTRAASGLAATMGRAAVSFKSFALSLVGGPWGLAVAGIAALGYAIYKMIDASKEYRAESDKQVKSLQDLASNAQAAAESYGRLGDRQTISQVTDLLGSSREELTAQSKALADARKEVEQLQQSLSHTIPVGADSWLQIFLDRRKLADATQRVKDLEASMPLAQAKVAQLAHEVDNSLTPAVDGLKRAIANVKAGGGLSGFFAGLATPEDIAAGVKSIEAAQATVTGAVTALDALATKAHKDLLTHGVTRVAQAQAELAVGLEGIKAERLSAEKEAQAVADLQAKYAKGLPDLQAADARDAAKKNAGAINAQAEEYKSLVAQINSRIEQDKEAAQSTDTLTEAEKLQIKIEEQFKAGKTKLSTTLQASARQMLGTAVAQGTLTRNTLLQRDAEKSLLDLDRQLAEQRQQQDRDNARVVEGVGHGSQWNAEREGIESIQDAYRKQREEADKAYESAKLQKGASVILDEQHALALGKIIIAEHEAIAAQDAFYANEKKKQADWHNGVNAAIEDFMTTQQNVAQQAQDFTNTFLNDGSGALAKWASRAEDAKQAFGDWIDSMYQAAWKFVADKAIQALFDSFGNGTNQTAGTTNGGWGSLISNFASYFSSSGGKAGGGGVSPGGRYQVTENGTEMLRIGDRGYLLMGNESGTVVPNNQLGGGGGRTSITNVYVQPTSTRRTAEQIAVAVDRKQRVATTRNG
jgi:lambda family phage tail tape measure protein